MGIGARRPVSLVREPRATTREAVQSRHIIGRRPTGRTRCASSPSCAQRTRALATGAVACSSSSATPASARRASRRRSQSTRPPTARGSCGRAAGAGRRPRTGRGWRWCARCAPRPTARPCGGSSGRAPTSCCGSRRSSPTGCRARSTRSVRPPARKRRRSHGSVFSTRSCHCCARAVRTPRSSCSSTTCRPSTRDRLSHSTSCQGCSATSRCCSSSRCTSACPSARPTPRPRCRTSSAPVGASCSAGSRPRTSPSSSS